MRLFLVRHGEALPKTADPLQPLSPDGKRCAFLAADALLQVLRHEHLACDPRIDRRHGPRLQTHGGSNKRGFESDAGPGTAHERFTYPRGPSGGPRQA